MVETRRSDVAFEAISKATGGVVVPLGLASTDFGALFRSRIEPTARRRRDDLRIAERVERFPAFLLPAIGFGLTASWPGLARRRGRRLAYSGLAFALLSTGAGPAAETAADLVERGRRAYASGQFAEALEAFDRAIAQRLRPPSPASTRPRRCSNSAVIPRPSSATKKPGNEGTTRSRSRSITPSATPTSRWGTSPRPSPATMPASRRHSAANRSTWSGPTRRPTGNSPRNGRSPRPSRPSPGARTRQGRNANGHRPDLRTEDRGTAILRGLRIGRRPPTRAEARKGEARRLRGLEDREGPAGAARPRHRRGRPRPGSTPRSTTSERPGSAGRPTPLLRVRRRGSARTGDSAGHFTNHRRILFTGMRK